MIGAPWVLPARNRLTPAMFKVAHRSITSSPYALRMTRHAAFRSFAMLISSPTSLRLQVPKPEQIRRTLRGVTTVPQLHPPQSGQALYATRLDRDFAEALEAGDVDRAYDLWSCEGERILQAVAAAQGHSLLPGASRRGHHTFHDQRRHPPTLHEQASTRVWKALCRCREVAVASPGYRRDRTWAAASKLLDHLSSDLRASLRVLLQRPASQEAATAAVNWLSNHLECLQRQDRTECISRWKKTPRANDSACYGHVRNKAKHAPSLSASL